MEVTEAGRRMSEVVNNVRLADDWDNVKSGWMAFALEDGRSDGTVYDSRDDAIRFNKNKARKFFYLTLRNCIHGITPKEATLALAAIRAQSERGRYHPEVEGSKDPILPLTREDYNNELMSTKLGAPYVVPKLGEYLDRIRH